MPTRALVFAASLLAASLTLPACGHSTTVEQVWRAPGFEGSFAHVLVFGLAKRPGVRRAFESGVCETMREAGVTCTPAFELFPGDGELEDEAIQATLAERGIDSVLSARLLSIDKQKQYVEGTPYVVGGPRPRFYGYYHNTYTMLHSPGYTIEYAVVKLESNLYSLGDGSVVWSGLSETVDPKDVEAGVRSYAGAMSATLIEAGLLRPNPGS